jgi:hypothetical protein
MRTTRCQECRRYLDGLTDGAERHPLYDRLCVACGNEAQREEGGHSRHDQQLRERLLYPEACS